MKSRAPKLFQVVTLRHDRPGSGLVRGQKGAIVEVHGNGTAFEVEFVDQHGRTIRVETLVAADVQLAPRRIPLASV